MIRQNRRQACLPAAPRSLADRVTTTSAPRGLSSCWGWGERSETGGAPREAESLAEGEGDHGFATVPPALTFPDAPQGQDVTFQHPRRCGLGQAGTGRGVDAGACQPQCPRLLGVPRVRSSTDQRQAEAWVNSEEGRGMQGPGGDGGDAWASWGSPTVFPSPGPRRGACSADPGPP